MTAKTLTPQLDGARILWHVGFSSITQDGWVREFSADGSHARISQSQGIYDRGGWYRTNEVVVLAELDPAKSAPAPLEKESED